MANQFAINPLINIQRSKFNQNHVVKTSFNAGKLIPVDVKEILPGDTVKLKTNIVIRTSTPLIKPIMDNLFLDVFYFFVPNRTVWEHWKEFMGENNSTYWTQTTQYTVPKLKPSSNSGSMVYEKTVADYFGIPVGVKTAVNHLPFRGYCKIFNDWFRDENVMTPAYYLTNDSDVNYETSNPISNSYVNSAYRGGALCPVAKLHDQFTSALPQPQKGIDVTVPLGLTAPVYGDGTSFNLEAASNNSYPYWLGGPSVNNGSTVSANIFNSTGSNLTTASNYGLVTKGHGNSHVYTDLSTATASSINQLRQAFQLQKMFEKDARGGTRYVEILKNHFGVTSSDATLQRAEYLGGKRIPININQVVQTSQATSSTATDPASSPTGNVGAYSLTADSSDGFTKSFEEHGYLFTLCCVRQLHSYNQGVNKMWLRDTRESFYFPVFANLGEQPLLNKELYCQGDGVVDSSGKIIDNQVFGYQEAWYEYRYTPSKITSQMRTTATNSFQNWHLGDHYTSLPTLSNTFIQESDANILRSLNTSSTLNDEFIADFYFEEVDTRPMPLYSIPGLIDHH